MLSILSFLHIINIQTTSMTTLRRLERLGEGGGGREERRLSTTALGGAPNGSVEGKVRERAVFLDVLLLTVQRGQLSLFFNS